MEYQKKVIFLRLVSFGLFFNFGINILLGDYFKINNAIYIVLSLFVLNFLMAFFGYKKYSNVNVTISKKEEQTNKILLLVLLVLFIANFVLKNQFENLNKNFHLVIAILIILGSIGSAITQILILKRD